MRSIYTGRSGIQNQVTRLPDQRPQYDGLQWLLERLPDAAQYIGLFGDAPAVGVAREPNGVDTVNDPHHDIRMYFAALRTHEVDLLARLATSDPTDILEEVPRQPGIEPSTNLLEETPTASNLDPVELAGTETALIDRAAATFIRAGGLNPLCSLATTPGRWTFHTENQGSLSQPTDHENLLTRIHDVADRLRRTQMECEPVIDLVDRHDDSDALFFGVVPPAIDNTDDFATLETAFEGCEADVALVTADDTADSFVTDEWEQTPVPGELSLPWETDTQLLLTNFSIKHRSLDFDAYEGAATPQARIGEFGSGTTEEPVTPTPPGGSISVRGGKLLPFRWYGGKFNHLSWLLPLLPDSETFVEPFGGSGSVLINREPSPTEVYNDIDEEVTRFLRVLKGTPPEANGTDGDRNPTQTAELLRQIALSPFSRAELAYAATHSENDSTVEALERARLFFVRAGQTRTGLAQEASAGRWAYCKSTSRRTMSGAVSRWHGRLQHLYKTAERLSEVSIRNQDALAIVEEYGDNPEALIYCDPPYPHETRGDTNSYEYELDTAQHRELAAALKSCEAKVALSSYQSELYAELYEEAGWERFDSEEQTMHATKDSRIESVWMNYDPPSDS